MTRARDESFWKPLADFSVANVPRYFSVSVFYFAYPNLPDGRQPLERILEPLRVGVAENFDRDWVPAVIIASF